MSYNITSFKVKKIKDLCLPFAIVMAAADIAAVFRGNGMVSLKGWSEGFEIAGQIYPDNMLHIERVNNYGEGSGNVQDELIALLKQSTGTLEAVVVWEGGDTIERLTVVDGVVTSTEL